MTLSAQSEQESAQARRIEDAESRQRALTGQPNLTYLKPLKASRAALRRAVEEAEWLGDEWQAQSARMELDQVEAAIGRGETYQPEW